MPDPHVLTVLPQVATVSLDTSLMSDPQGHFKPVDFKPPKSKSKSKKVGCTAYRTRTPS
jgi:hypothetical protein